MTHAAGAHGAGAVDGGSWDGAALARLLAELEADVCRHAPWNDRVS